MAWIIQGNQLVNDEFVNSGTKPFVGDSPYIMWRYNNGDNLPYHPLMQSFTGTEPFVGDSPYTMWRIDPNANGGMPFVPLMIGVAKLAPEPPVTTPNIYFGSSKIVGVYYGTQAVNDVYFGNHKI